MLHNHAKALTTAKELPETSKSATEADIARRLNNLFKAIRPETKVYEQ